MLGVHKHDSKTVIKLAGCAHNCIGIVLGMFPSLSNTFTIVARSDDHAG